MCYDDIDEIGKRVEAVKAAKVKLVQANIAVTDSEGLPDEFTAPDLTGSELISIYEARLARAIARLNELVAPVKRVEPGDRAREIEALNSRRGLESQETRT